MYMNGKVINSKALLKIFFISISLEISMYANQGLLNCNDQYKEIWRSYLSGDIAQANMRYEQCTFSGEYINDAMIHLKSGLLYQEGNYQKAIETIEPIKERTIHLYNLKNDQLPKDEINDLYYHMLSVLGNSYFALHDYRNASKFYELWLESTSDSKIQILYYTAFSFYYLKEYDKTLKYFKQLYVTVPDIQRQSATAYNIAAIYALLDNTKESIKWLKISFQYTKEASIEKLLQDKDFETIKKNAEFQHFIKKNR